MLTSAFHRAAELIKLKTFVDKFLSSRSGDVSRQPSSFSFRRLLLKEFRMSMEVNLDAAEFSK